MKTTVLARVVSLSRALDSSTVPTIGAVRREFDARRQVGRRLRLGDHRAAS